MNLKKLTFIIMFIIVLAGFILSILIKRSMNDIINDDYIAIFHGEDKGYIYETYIYKIDNGHANRGFEYINVTWTLESYENSRGKYKINKKGEFEWTDGAFGVAKEHGAYSYVNVPNDNKKYTIEEFQRMFIMN